MSGNINITQTASLLGEVRLQVYYMTARSTDFVSGSTWRYIRLEDLAPDHEIRHSFGNGIDFDRIPHGRQAEYALAVRLGGKITSVDEVAFEGCRVDKEELHLWLTFTQVESLDGEPAPVEAFVLVPLNETITARRKLAIEFHSSIRSFDGQSTALKQSPVEAVTVVLPTAEGK